MTALGAGDRSAFEVLTRLRAQFPDSPFLALGQTVFWDEPVKAVLRRLLDAASLGGQMVAGVHDTDYFAKSHARPGTSGRFVLLPHNDGTTKDLWSAAGEISTLFGSESFPSRHDFVRYGVPFERLAEASPQGRQAFVDAMTEAWGWRGLVYTGSQDLIVHRLSLKEVGDGVLEMLTWGFENAITQVQPGCCQDEARHVANTILGWCQELRAAHPDANLSDLYQSLLPRFYELLLGYASDALTVTGTAQLLRFNPETCALPRFRFVGLFLDPTTRETALAAYNQAVTGSEIYTLDKFGAGALPFDVIVPERGRGTLRVTPRVVFVETRQPVAIGLKKPVESLQELADILCAKLGSEITLVGKAVSLISMLAQEFIFVFNEEGSLYVRRTRRMNDLLTAQGIPLDLRPILRLRFHTWDSLVVSTSTLRLPEHLATAFGQQTITTPEFAVAWKQVVAEQRALCEQVTSLKKPLDLIAFLHARDPLAQWEERRAEYVAAKERLLALRHEAQSLQNQVNALYAYHKALKANRLQTQEAMGAHFRAIRDWQPDVVARRAEFEAQLRSLDQEKAAVCAEVLNLKAQRECIERGPEAIAARATLRRIEDEAEMARLHLVRNALLTVESLTHTNHRPSAWWLPMINASGDWFQRIVATAELYTEPLRT